MVCTAIPSHVYVSIAERRGGLKAKAGKQWRGRVKHFGPQRSRERTPGAQKHWFACVTHGDVAAFPSCNLQRLIVF